MKAIKQKKDPEKLYINGIELDFNAMNENHQKRIVEIGEKVENAYPNAMNLDVVEDFDIAKGLSIDQVTQAQEKVTQNCELGTKAMVMFFNELFGEEKTTELLGKDPYFSKCLTVYTQFESAVKVQAAEFVYSLQKISSVNLNKYAPVGQKGSPLKTL